MADESTPLLSVNNSAHSFTSFRGTSELDHVEEAPSSRKPGLTRNLSFAVAACILGSSFQVGYNTSVVNSPADVIKDFYNSTYAARSGKPMPESVMTLLWAVTVSCYAAGGMVGGLSAGYWANRYGRKGALLRNNIVVVVAAGLMGFSKMAGSYEMLIVGRIISGVNAGVNSGVAPLYLSEISPVSLRGLCGTFNQIAICFGTVIGEVTGLEVLLGTQALWPITLGFPVLPVLFQLLTLPSCPEAPRFLLVVHNEDDEAEKGLVWLRGTEDVGEELEEMRREAAEQRNTVKFLVKDLFRNPELRWPLIISVVLMMAQQFSGINAVIYYSTTVFEGAGLSKGVSQYATVATGAVNVGWTFVSAALIDKLGRRTLMITGLGGMFVFTVVLTIALVFQSYATWLSYLCIGAVTLYIVAFATGPGAIPWFYVAELFAQGPRSAAVSVSVLVNWFSNFTVGLVFPELREAIQEYSFVPFAAMLLASFFFVVCFVPETKGKRIEDITLLFKTTDEQSESSAALTSDQSYTRLENQNSSPQLNNLVQS
ncbi:hypothetical protein ACOMHN_020637 [Nucella lapillus]